MKKPAASRIFLIGLLLVSALILLAKKTKMLTKSAAIKAVFLTSRYALISSYIERLAILESGNYTSRIYKEDNNFTGMGIASIRPQKIKGIDEIGEGGRPVAIYSNDVQCAEDLLAWFKYHNAPTSFSSDRAFISYLKSKNYFATELETYLSAYSKVK